MSMHHESFDLFVIPTPTEGHGVGVTWTEAVDGDGTLTAATGETLVAQAGTTWGEIVGWLRALAAPVAAMAVAVRLLDTLPL